MVGCILSPRPLKRKFELGWAGTALKSLGTLGRSPVLCEVLELFIRNSRNEEAPEFNVIGGTNRLPQADNQLLLQHRQLLITRNMGHLESVQDLTLEEVVLGIAGAEVFASVSDSRTQILGNGGSNPAQTFLEGVAPSLKVDLATLGNHSPD